MVSYLKQSWIYRVVLLLVCVPYLVAALVSPAMAQETMRLPLSAYDTEGNVELMWVEQTVEPTLLLLDRTSLSSFETEVVVLVNQERARYGLHPLVINSAITSAARKHSQDMADNDFFDHVGSDGSGFVTRLAREGYTNLCAGGENIAAGQTSPEAVVSAWMNSPSHRANILNVKFREIGVGYIYEPDDTFSTLPGWGYKHYWTQDFGSQDCYAPTPTFVTNATPTSTRTATRTYTPTSTRTWTPVYSATPTSTRTATRTYTPTSTCTWTPTSTATPPDTDTPTRTPTPTFTRVMPTATSTRVPLFTPTPTWTVTTLGATLAGSVDLQGRPAKPSACWAVPLAVTMYRQDGSIYHMVPLQTTMYGEFVMPNLVPGVYDIRLKSPLTLANVKAQVELHSGLNMIDFGTLISGDCSDDNVIDVLDFSLLRSSFGTDAQEADLNNDGIVDVFDFSLLRTHFGMSGDIELN